MSAMPDTPVVAPASEPGRSTSAQSLVKLLSRNGRLVLAFVILAALLLVYIERVPQFGPREQRSVVNQGLPLVLAGFGQTIVVLTGGIDLSMGSMIGLTNSVASRITNGDSQERVWLAALACLGIGALGGLINGLIVAYGRLQPIIVTLATSSIFAGIALYVRPQPGGKFPSHTSQYWTGSMDFRAWPRGVVLLSIMIVVWLFFRRTRLATRIVAIGSSEGAAFMSGVNVNRAKVAAYTISGLAAGFCGFFLTVQTGNGNALAGQTYTLNSIAAVVLGGASLAGGSGTFLGTIAGAYTIALIPRVLFFYDVSQFYQQLLQGMVLLVAVGLGAVGVLRARNRLDKI
jgi:ribose transport system permease protein